MSKAFFCRLSFFGDCLRFGYIHFPMADVYLEGVRGGGAEVVLD